MEIFLATVVIAAVIFFGALISLGNERQRKAIDDLREQAMLWAVQDLRIKREELAHNVHVDDPLSWLNGIVTKVINYNLNLQVVDALDEPRALICTSRDGMKIAFSPLSRMEIQRVNGEKRSKLSQFAASNPLLDLPRKVKVYEFSVLNSGILFDLELRLAWIGLTGQEIGQMDRLWMYVINID